MLPYPLAVVVEDHRRVLWGRKPCAAGNLIVELPGAPTGIAEGDDGLLGTATMPHVAQDVAVGRHRHAAIDIDRIRMAVLGGVHDEADVRLDRAPDEDADAPLDGVMI